MRLREVLGVRRGDVVSFVGAGGKTSALVRLGQELATDGWRVLATTTTRISETELSLFPFTQRWNPKLLRGSRELEALLDTHRFIFLYKGIQDEKAVGISGKMVSRLVDEMNADVLLVEADGSRRLPLKAPYDHEPALPVDSTLVVPIAGLEILGQPLNQDFVYNPQGIIDRYGFPYGGIIQPAWIAQVVRDEELGLKKTPPTARVIALLNQSPQAGLIRARGRRAAQMILRNPRVDSVAIGSVKAYPEPIFEVQRRVTAIVLAGGLSSRMGSSKVLLPWGDRTVIETIVQTLMPFRFDEIVVVTGHKTNDVQKVLKKYPVRVEYNPAFAIGEMVSSLKTGLRTLSDDVSSCMVVMGDQPQLSTKVVRHLLTTLSEGSNMIIAPRFQQRRGHPILIPSRYWHEILSLPGRAAPREAINKHPIKFVQVEDDSILRDIDTPEQYAYEKRIAGLE
jgi:molybdenum cofactor cytidylyltransferase